MMPPMAGRPDNNRDGGAEERAPEIAEARLRARKALIAAVGEEGFVDAAGVVASFNAVVRIADATGIPVEDFKLEKTVEERAALGIDDWH